MMSPILVSDEKDHETESKSPGWEYITLSTELQLF